MERRQETTVTIAELAAQKEAGDQAEYREIVNKLQVAGGLTNVETSQAQVSSTPQDEIKSVPGIQILTNPTFVNEEKNGDKGKVEQSKTWKDKTNKRKADKTSRRS